MCDHSTLGLIGKDCAGNVLGSGKMHREVSLLHYCDRGNCRMLLFLERENTLSRG